MSGLRWRAWSSLALFVVAVFGTGVSAFGIMYLGSADQSILNGTLDPAPVYASGITLQPKAASQPTGFFNSVTPPLQVKAPGRAAALQKAITEVPRAPDGTRWWGAPVRTELAGFTTTGTGQQYTASLVSRSDLCSHLVMASGKCLLRKGSALLSARSAAALGLHPGDRLTLDFLQSAKSAPLVVAGTFRSPNPTARYWWGQAYFGFGTAPPRDLAHALVLDDVFAGKATLASAAPASRTTQLAQLPYRPRSLSAADVPGLQASLARFERTAKNDGVDVSTGMSSLLGAARSGEHATGTIVGVVDLELVLLGLFVLYFVASRTAGDREPDVRLAELRGYRPTSALAVALAEPMIIVAAAVPVGLFCAWVAAETAAGLAAGGGIGASPTLLAVVAAIATGVVGIGATALGTRRMFARDGAGLDIASPRASVWRTVGDVAVVAVAAAAFFELVAVGVSGSARSSGADPLAAFAPGLLALAIGLLGARLAPVILRSTHARTARSPRLALSLAVRRVARRREFAAQIMLVAVAVGLAAFAVSGWSIAGVNRTVRSAFDVGAAKVDTVKVRPGTTFASAVQSADGHRGSAMAAVVERAPDGTTLALDASSMASVASWAPGLGATLHVLARRLAGPRTVGVPLLTGSAVRVTVDTTKDARPQPSLVLKLFNDGRAAPETLVLGTLRRGVATYGAAIPGGCPSGCRIENLSVTWTGTAYASMTAKHGPTVDFTVTGISERLPPGRWVGAGEALGRPHLWTSTTSTVAVRPGPNGLVVAMTLPVYAQPRTIAPAGALSALPVAVTPHTAGNASGHGGPLVVGLDGASVPGHTVGQIASVPGIGPDANLVDFADAEQFMAGPMSNTTDEVWLSSTAPRDISSRLRAEGVTVLSQRTAVSAAERLSHSGVSLAYLMFLIAAVAAAVLAVGSMTFALVSSARRRSGELAAMRAVGISAAVLRRAVWAEQLLALGTGVALGCLAGLVAAVIALPSIPELVGVGPGPPLQYPLPAVALAVTIGGSLVALVVATGLGSSVVVGRGAVAERIGGSGGRSASRPDEPILLTDDALGEQPVLVTAATPGGVGASGEAQSNGKYSASTGGAAVRLTGVVHIYHQSGEDVVGLRGVDLDIDAGEMVALLGPSGMGKTTLMRLMAGAMSASAGLVEIGDQNLGRLRPAERRRLRGSEVSYVVQGTGANVLPFATAIDNVWFAQHGVRVRGHRPPWAPGDLLEVLGLGDLAEVRMATLPPGRQQMVAVASGIATGPRLLLADEPTAQLGEGATVAVIDLLRQINSRFGTTVVIVTHDPFVASCFPRTITIRDGRIGAEGLDGHEYAVVDGSGSVQLPPEALNLLPPNTRVRVALTATGVELHNPELEQ